MSTQPQVVHTAGSFKFSPPKAATKQNPTTLSLMKATDKTGWRSVRVPELTLAAGVMFEPIHLGRFSTEKFMPGKTYHLPPEVATELEDNIRRYEAVPIGQMTGNVKVTAAIQREVDARDRARAGE